MMAVLLWSVYWSGPLSVDIGCLAGCLVLGGHGLGLGIYLFLHGGYLYQINLIFIKCLYQNTLHMKHIFLFMHCQNNDVFTFTYMYIHLSYFFLYHTQNPFYIIQGMRYSEVHVIEWTLHKFSTIQILNSLVSYVLPSPVTLPSPSSVAPPV